MNKSNKENNVIKDKVLSSILEEFPWKNIQKYILQKPILLEDFKKGGFELKAKNKSHAISVIFNNITEEVRSELFFMWYGNVSEYSDFLDKFFNSDDYKKWAKSKKLKIREYALPNLQFNKLCYRLSKRDAQIFLYLSPIKFSKEQIQLLLEIPGNKNQKDNAYEEILRKYKKAQKKIKEIESDQSRLKKEIRDFLKEKSDSDKLRTEIGNLKKKIKSVHLEKSELQKQFESTSKLAEHRMIEKYNECESEKNKALLKVEELKNLLGQAKKKIGIKEELANDLQSRVEKYEREKDDLFCNILDKIDLRELISELNEPDEVKELLENIVKIPEKDEKVRAERPEIILKEFWQNSLRIEEKILNNILSIDAASIKKGDYFREWGKHADDFVDLKHTLRAKIVLINLLYEILRKQLKNS